MKKFIVYIISIILLLSLGINVYATKKKEFSNLENSLNNRELYSNKKEKKIDSLKRLAASTFDEEELLSIYDKIYNEYYTYRFDSAMHYVEKLETLTSNNIDSYYNILARIHRSVLLSTSGHFSESVVNLNQINRSKLDNKLLLEYYLAYEWAYRVWGEYSDDKTYAPIYRKKELAYQDSIISILKPGTNDYYFWRGENLYRKGKYNEAEQAYFKSLKGTPIDTRLYARAMYGLAMVNSKLDKWNLYEEYLIEAAISDQICPLKENLALQQLALYIYKSNNKEVERANKYLDYSMDDALFYNNRLRLLEISKKIPEIVYSYQKKYLTTNKQLKIYLGIISILFIGILGLIILIYRQIGILHMQKGELSNVNGQLHDLNIELINTNKVREEYVSLFLSLCAAYIDKLNKYQSLVRRKVKLNQIDDLLKVANAARLTESDSKEFFLNFDTAFLNLYPTFISEFNDLLIPGEEIKLKKGEIMSPELRIYALIRIGITDSTKIANLLFYSTQTIYNYRSTIRAKAKNKETFEKDVQELCRTI